MDDNGIIEVGGLLFTPVPMDNFVHFFEAYEKTIPHERVVCLIQDIRTKLFETKSCTPWNGLTLLRLISRGKCSVLLQRKYGIKVVLNIRVWIASTTREITQDCVMRTLSGQWIDGQKEVVYAKREANRYIRRKPHECRRYKEQFPTFFAKMAQYEPLEEHIR